MTELVTLFATLATNADYRGIMVLQKLNVHKLLCLCASATMGNYTVERIP